jgi:hypothetical protein
MISCLIDKLIEMYVIRTNSRTVGTYKSHRKSFKVAWEGSGGCGAKEMKES